jgi:hypothetical protein
MSSGVLRFTWWAVIGARTCGGWRACGAAAGGGRRAILTRGAGAAARAERSRAIRAAVAGGWDADLVAAALLGAVQPTLW